MHTHNILSIDLNIMCISSINLTNSHSSHS